jgi:hypothetical protein
VRIEPGRIALGVVGLAVGVLSVFELRVATMSTHSPVDPSSRLDVIVSARTRGGERDQSLREMVEALVLGCRLEVAADLDGPIRDEGNGRFRVALEPSLDKSNRRQLRGCLEDWTIDQLLVDVVAFQTQH